MHKSKRDVYLYKFNNQNRQIMTTLSNTTMRDIVAKTSFEYGSLEADLMITSMGCGYSFIKSYIMSKSIQTK